VEGDLGHGAPRLAPAVGRAAGVEDEEAVGGDLVQRDVGVPEDHAPHVREAAAQAGEAPGRRAGVVDEREAQAVDVHAGGGRQRGADRWLVRVAVHGDDRGADGTDGPQRGEVEHVAGVEDQVGGGEGVPARRREVSGSPRHVRVRDHRDAPRRPVHGAYASSPDGIGGRPSDRRASVSSSRK
jgi:hypothetical protein